MTNKSKVNCALTLIAAMTFVVSGIAELPPGYKGKPFQDAVYTAGPQHIPGRVECAYYDLGGEGVAYHDTDTTNHGSGELNLKPEHQRPHANPYIWGFRADEGMDISYTKDFADFNHTNFVAPVTNQLYIGWTADGEWCNYTVNVKAGAYRVIALYGNATNTIRFSINQQPATECKLPLATGSMHKWNKGEIGTITFSESGLQLLTFHYNAGNNFAYFEFEPVAKPFLMQSGSGQNAASLDTSLANARQGFATKLVRKTRIGEPAPEPPPKLFRSIKYPSPIGQLAAYVSSSPGDGRKHPAIIWIVGGFANSIGQIAWEPSSPENDQSASAFWRAGIITMYPSLRGGNENPGFIEGFYGEVDDVIAAADYLKKLDYVDPKRVYLGGHSTGGTLALLVAESTNCFRSVFSFGPVADVRVYGSRSLPFDVSDRKELDLRAPGRWLRVIRNPTYVFEGTEQRSNLEELESLSRANQNPLIHFHPVRGASHFSVLAPITRLVATNILHDNGASSNITFSELEFSEAFKQK